MLCDGRANAGRACRVGGRGQQLPGFPRASRSAGSGSMHPPKQRQRHECGGPNEAGDGHQSECDAARHRNPLLHPVKTIQEFVLETLRWRDRGKTEIIIVGRREKRVSRETPLRRRALGVAASPCPTVDRRHRRRRHASSPSRTRCLPPVSTLLPACLGCSFEQSRVWERRGKTKGRVSSISDD